MRLVGTLVTIALLLAGCAGEPTSPSPSPGPSPSAPSPPSSTPLPSPTPTPTPGGGGIRAGSVDVQLILSPHTIRAGDPLSVTIVAFNGLERSIFTNPQFACSGTWDVALLDEAGARVRIDDRDAMGCPSGGLLETEVVPGEEARATYAWDGFVRPTLGQTRAPEPGTYTVVASVGYANATSVDRLDVRKVEAILTITS